MKAFSILFALIIIAFCRVPSYASVPNELQLWPAIILETPINDKFNFYLDLQPRIGEDVTQLSVLVVRPAVYYKINNELALAQGFSWQPRVTPVFVNEARPYQEIIYRKRYENFNLNLRSRTEERIISGTSGASLRQRFLVRFEVPIGNKDEWCFVSGNELFINLNSLPVGPKGGIDQARVFLGFCKKLSETSDVEFGYMFNPIINDYPGSNTIRHNIMVIFNFNFDKSQKRFYTPSVPY